MFSQLIFGTLYRFVVASIAGLLICGAGMVAMNAAKTQQATFAVTDMQAQVARVAELGCRPQEHVNHAAFEALDTFEILAMQAG